MKRPRLCHLCGKPVPPRFRSWCSEECHELAHHPPKPPEPNKYKQEIAAGQLVLV